MMKLTKTEERILTHLRTYGYYTVETGSGRGPSGGRIKFGARERDAMFSLRDKGLAMITSREPWVDVRSGYTVSGTIFNLRPVQTN